MALASPAYSFAPCRAAPFTDNKDSFTPLYSDLMELVKRVNANENGSLVNLLSYTTSLYTFPSDGYVILDASQATGNKLLTRIYSSNGGLFNFGSYQTSGGWNALFVKKGMKVQVSQNVGTNNYANFMPLISTNN